MPESGLIVPQSRWREPTYEQSVKIYRLPLVLLMLAAQAVAVLGLLIGTCRVAAFAVNIGMFGLSLAEGTAILLCGEAGAARMGTFLRFRHE